MIQTMPFMLWFSSLLVLVLVLAGAAPAASATKNQPFHHEDEDNGIGNNLRRPRHRAVSYINNQLSSDARWKSTKLTQKQKAAMGLFPPPGEQWPEDPPELLAKNQAAAGGGTLTVVDTPEQEETIEQEIKQEEEQKEDEDPRPLGSRRVFLSYTPSKFEEAWTDNIDKYNGNRKICQTTTQGKHQKRMMYDFMEFLCTAPLEGTDWCYWNDHKHFVWYNKGNKNAFEIYIDKTPMELQDVTPPPIKVRDESNDFQVQRWDLVASKFTFLDETTGEMYHEYIEPIVGHLRFPLAECLEHNNPALAEFASYILPPPSLHRVMGRTMLFDVGSSDWSRLEYLMEEWEGRNANISVVNAYSANGDEVNDAFLKTIPKHHQSKIFRHYLQLVDFPLPDKDKVFLPRQIHIESFPEDYVMVKLDRFNGKLKQELVHFITKNVGPMLHVDELFWEVNARDNHALERWMSNNLQDDEMSDGGLPEAYRILQTLRHKGIRAHAWI